MYMPLPEDCIRLQSVRKAGLNGEPLDRPTNGDPEYEGSSPSSSTRKTK